MILASSSTCLLQTETAVCDKLNHLPHGIGSVRYLRSLTIGSFSGDSKERSSQSGSTELKFLPQKIQYLSGLRNLTIWGYAALEALPEWVANLKYLQILKHEFCWKLMYLPPADKLRQLKSLKELNICFCPLLRTDAPKLAAQSGTRSPIFP